MAAITDDDLRKHLERTKGGLANIRKPVETGTAEVARYCQRWLSPWIANLGGDTSTVNSHGQQQKAGKANNRLYNSKAVRSHRTLANGMSSGMSSPSQPWFKLSVSDPDLAQFHEVRVWLDDVTAAIYAFLAQTNIYNAMQFGYGELGWAGAEATLFVPDWKYGAIAYPLTFGEYWLGQDYGLRVDTLYRSVPMTVGQMRAKFGYEKLSRTTRKLYDDDKLYAIVDVMHAVEPNLEREYGKIDRTNKPFRSIYWETGSDKSGILAFEGFTRKPMATPRWAATGSDVYSWGPGFEALPDARKLQLQELRLQQGVDYGVRPALQMPIGDMNRGANLVPGGLTYTTSADLSAGARAVWEVDPKMVNYMTQDITGRTEPAVDEAFFAHLFMAITNMRGVQPRNMEEIARRHEEQLSQLGPVVDRVQTEKLSVIILQAFDILSEAGRLSAAPRAMVGRQVNIEFTSILAQAQKMIGLGAMERALGFIGNIAGIYPQIVDKVDLDEAVDEYTLRLGTPTRILRSDEDVAAARAARAQAAQAEKMAAMAPAVQQVAAGAELLSRTDAGGQPLLDRLLPQPGV